MYPTIRIGQINVMINLEGREDRYARLADHLVKEQISIAAIQEVSDPVALQRTLEAAGFLYFAWGEPYYHEMHDLTDQVAIASKVPILNSTPIPLSVRMQGAVAASFEINGTIFNLGTAHFAWGFEQEALRLQQAEEVDCFAKDFTDKGEVFIFAGDLNAVPESQTMRYLTGLGLGSDGKSTHWADAFLMSDKPHQWATSDPNAGIMAKETAKFVGILLPELIPPRRIDYILVRGWSYGRIGSPIGYGRFGDPLANHVVELSDHYGIWADCLIPEPS